MMVKYKLPKETQTNSLRDDIIPFFLRKKKVANGAISQHSKVFTLGLLLLSALIIMAFKER